MIPRATGGAKRWRLLAMALLLLVAPVCPDSAADEAIKRGQALADRLCAGCHAVGRSDASKLATAPPMRDLARRWNGEQIAEALAEGITTGHKEMPEFRFNQDQLSAFLSYFDALGASAPKPAAKP